MLGTFLLARRYIAFHRGRTAILMAAITLTVYLPLLTHWTIGQFQKQATRRARATPLVVGAKGSRFGLALHALYFRGDAPEAITMTEVDRIRESGLAATIPLLACFRARGYVILGTSPDYFTFRRLTVAEGATLKRLGDCILGARVAQGLGLQPGDRLLSEPENLFDLSGPAPLNMRVVGILEKTGTSDDDMILVDLKTTWIIQGIGHGHAADPKGDDADQHGASRANLSQHAAVTDRNVESFHFHGSADEFPLSAIIAIPHSEKSEALLMGHYLAPDQTLQILKPSAVIDELMDVILKARKLFDLGMILLAVGTLLLIGLVMLLSLRLRQREMDTMFRLGCSRGTIFQIQMAELVIVLMLSLVLASGLAWGSMSVSGVLFHAWLG